MFSSGRRNAFVAIRRHAWRNFPAETDAARIYTARNDATRPRRRERHARRGTCTRQLATDVWPDAPENRALLPLRQRTASRAPAWCHEGRGNGNVFSVPPGPGRARVTDAASALPRRFAAPELLVADGRADRAAIRVRAAHLRPSTIERAEVMSSDRSDSPSAEPARDAARRRSAAFSGAAVAARHAVQCRAAPLPIRGRCRDRQRRIARSSAAVVRGIHAGAPLPRYGAGAARASRHQRARVHTAARTARHAARRTARIRRLTGTKKGCDRGRAARARCSSTGGASTCLTLAVMHEGARITTVEWKRSPTNARPTSPARARGAARAAFIGGGTNLLDLMGRRRAARHAHRHHAHRGPRYDRGAARRRRRIGAFRAQQRCGRSSAPARRLSAAVAGAARRRVRAIAQHGDRRRQPDAAHALPVFHDPAFAHATSASPAAARRSAATTGCTRSSVPAPSAWR